MKLEELGGLITEKLKNNVKLKDIIINNKIDNILDKIDFVEGKYNKNKVYSNDKLEIYVISWWPNIETEYHNHPKNGCILKMVFGELIEEKKKETISKTILKKNEQSYIDDSMGVHKIIVKKPSVSVHIYSPPGFYD